jgi:hypothetical protein
LRKWQPFAEPTRRDVWLDVSNAIPTPHGTYRNAPGFTGSGTTVASAVICNAYQLELPTGAYTNVAASVEAIHTWSGTTFTDRTKVGGYNPSTTHWSVTQFGIYTVATNGYNPPQVRDATGSSAFADLGGTPPSTAKYAAVQSNVLLLANSNTGGQYVHFSDVGNHANFTSGEAGSVPLNHRPGAITAMVPFRDEVIVFKESCCFRLRYVGLPVIWTVDLISSSHGATGPGAVASCGDFLAVLDQKNGGYLFDGSGFHRIDDGIKNYLIQVAFAPVAAQFFKNQESVWWNIDTRVCITYNLKSQAWGKFTVAKPDSETQDYVSIHRLMVGQGIYDEMRGATFIAPSDNYPILTSFAEDEAAGQNNTALNGYVTTGLFGTPGAMTQVSGVVPYLKTPDSVISTTNVPAASAMTMTPYTLVNPEGTVTTGSNVSCSTAAQKRFDYNKSAQWHKFKIAFADTPWEIDDVGVTAPDRVNPPRTAGRSP